MSGVSQEPRVEAVRLRLAGHTLQEISRLTGLSVPTISAAHKRFLESGWSSVVGRPRGRREGEGRCLDSALSRALFHAVTTQVPEALGLSHRLWVISALRALPTLHGQPALSARTAANYLSRWQLAAPRPSVRLMAGGQNLERWKATVYSAVLARAQCEGRQVFWLDETVLPSVDQSEEARGARVIRAVNLRGKIYWMGHGTLLQERALIDFFDRLLACCGGKAFVVLDGMQWQRAAALSASLAQHRENLYTFHLPTEHGSQPKIAAPTPLAVTDFPATRGAEATELKLPSNPFAQQLRGLVRATPRGTGAPISPWARGAFGHLERLEAESIHIFREVVAECERPVLLYSAGKDSAVMLHLARKAFYPARPPFPLLHIDTTWKFRELYEYRDCAAREAGLELIVHVNEEGLATGINPFTHGASLYTGIMKTDALKQAMERRRFDAAFGGGRRDEEKSRAKERICSLRSPTHHWDPKDQRPEPWQLLNTQLHRGESLRVFPLSNWTEIDIWEYILQQRIALPSLYFAKARPVVERDGHLIVVDDERFPLTPGEAPVMKRVRFRTLGCYPLTAAIPSQADTPEGVVAEVLAAQTCEREGRLIDRDSLGSMERKKLEGYF